MLKNKLQIPCQKLINGGQTGVDRGALDACLRFDFPCGGWCPLGRHAEDGIIPDKYPLQETLDTNYRSRTRQNVLDSDGTLILSTLPIIGGTKLTAELANQYNKPLMIISVETPFENVIKWLIQNNVKILNVAGPRESEWTGATAISYQLITKLITYIRKNV